MATAWLDEIFSSNPLYVNVTTWISSTNEYSKRVKPKNMFESFHARQLGLKTVLDYDGLEDALETNGSLVVRDRSDMTLLRLLYANRKRLYLALPGGKTKVIDVERLRKRIRSVSRAYSTTSFNNILFLAPMVLLTGFPNQLSLQQSANPESLRKLFEIVNVARGKVYDLDAEAMDTIRFRRIVNELADQEIENISNIVDFVKSRGRKNVYDPKSVEFKYFAETFYTYNDFVEDDKTDGIVLAYAQNLMEFSKYMRGKSFYPALKLQECPLLTTIRDCFAKIGEQYICSDAEYKIECDAAKSTKMQDLNRYPPLI